MAVLPFQVSQGVAVTGERHVNIAIPAVADVLLLVPRRKPTTNLVRRRRCQFGMYRWMPNAEKPFANEHSASQSYRAVIPHVIIVDRSVVPMPRHPFLLCFRASEGQMLRLAAGGVYMFWHAHALNRERGVIVDDSNDAR